MADKRISELTAATAVGSSDFTVLVQGNVTKKVPVSTLLDGGLMNYTNIGENTTPISSDFIVTIKAGQPKKLLLSNLLTVTNQSFYNLIQEVQTASVDDKFVFDTDSGLKKLRIRSFLIGENIDNTGLGVASYDPTDFVTVVSNGLNKKLVISDLVANTPINHQLAQTTNTFVGADTVLFVNNSGVAKVSIQNLLEQAPVNQSLYNTATSFSGSNKLLVIDDTVSPASIKKVTVSNILAEAPINTAGLSVLDAVDTTDKLVVETSLGVKKLTISDLIVASQPNYAGYTVPTTFAGTDTVVVIQEDGPKQVAIDDIIATVPTPAINDLVSAVTAVTDSVGTDEVLIVQSATVKKIGVKDLIETLDTQPLITSEEDISIDAFTTTAGVYAAVFDSADPISGNLADGNLSGKIENKYLVNIGAGTVTVTATGRTFTTLTLPQYALVKLVWIDSKWWIESEVGATHG